MSDQIIAGINPATRVCSMIGLDDDDQVRDDARREGLIVVPITAETARKIFGNVIDDVYSIARSTS